MAHVGVPAYRLASCVQGGSSVECVTEHQEITQRMLWTNMGHTRNRQPWDPPEVHISGPVDECRTRCTFAGVAPKVVVSVREPYHYWRSLFTYAWVGEASAVSIPEGVHSFAGFVRAADAHATPGPHGSRVYEHSLSTSLFLSCGRPCRYDYLLHTETLASDWLHLLRRLEMPLVALPHHNPTNTASSNPPPPTVFTAEVLQIINTLEANVFEEFGYERRSDQFELT
jgi:hypothetical protein